MYQERRGIDAEAERAGRSHRRRTLVRLAGYHLAMYVGALRPARPPSIEKA